MARHVLTLVDMNANAALRDLDRPIAIHHALRLLAEHGLDVIDGGVPDGTEDFIRFWELHGRRPTVSAMLLWLGY